MENYNEKECKDGECNRANDLVMRLADLRL